MRIYRIQCEKQKTFDETNIRDINWDQLTEFCESAYGSCKNVAEVDMASSEMI